MYLIDSVRELKGKTIADAILVGNYRAGDYQIIVTSDGGVYMQTISSSRITVPDMQDRLDELFGNDELRKTLLMAGIKSRDVSKYVGAMIDYNRRTRRRAAACNKAIRDDCQQMDACDDCGVPFCPIGGIEEDVK